jgi:hypothetical protein
MMQTALAAGRSAENVKKLKKMRRLPGETPMLNAYTLLSTPKR